MVNIAKLLFFLCLFLAPLSSAVLFDNPNLPIVRVEEFDTNISVDSAENWDTSDHGKLSAVSELMHNWLGGLQGGASGEYYHLTSAMYSYLVANLNDFLTANYFDQDLNTTDDVTFNDITVDGTISGDGSGLTGVPFNYPHDQELNTTDSVVFQNLNVTNHIEAFTINATNITTENINVTKNSTIYLGGVPISSATTFGGQQVVTFGDAFVNATGYFGDGGFLDNISFVNGSIIAIGFSGDIFTGGNFTGNNFSGEHAFFDIYDLNGVEPWIIFDGKNISFNESYFNSSVLALSEVTLREESLTVVSSGGSASASTVGLDFEIKQITVVPNALTTKYRFEAITGTTGEIVDKDRKTHVGVWSIEKNFPIDDYLNLSITSAVPDDTFNITIKYLTQPLL